MEKTQSNCSMTQVMQLLSSGYTPKHQGQLVAPCAAGRDWSQTCLSKMSFQIELQI